MWPLVRRNIEGESRLMGATYNFSLGFAQGTESKAETPDRLLKRQPLQEICTGMSLVSLCLGFSVFGMLIIVNRHQADPNGLSGDSFVATAGGIGAILVGMAFLVAACLHRRFCDSRSAAPSDRRQPEPLSLTMLKAALGTQWPMTSLLDMLKETDFRVGFTDTFKSPTAWETMERAALQPRLLLCL
jgi:hypothetical protein